MSDTKKRLAQAQAFNNNKEYQKTLDLLSDQDLEVWKSADLYAEKAQAFYRLNRFEDSKTAAEAALEIEPKHSKGNHYLGNWYYAEKEYDQAEAYYLKAIQAAPTFPYPYNALGNFYKNKKEYDQAEAYYLKAIQVGPTFSYPYNGLGNLYADKKEYDQAESYYLKAIQVDPTFSYPYNGLGNLYADKKEYDQAESYYLKAIQVDPTYAYPFNGLGLLYADKKEYDQAEAYYLKAIQVDPTFSYPYNGLGVLYYDKKDYDQAEAYYLKGIQADPNYASAFYNLGLLYKDTQKNTKAKDAFQKYLALTDEKADFFFKQAQAFIVELDKLIESGDDYKKINQLTQEIKSLLLLKGACITHYTSLSAARAMLLEGSKFRLSEGAFLNDTSEGRELFRYLNFHVTASNHHETVAELFSQKPFIGSFVHEDKYDDLTLWRMYGKENKEEARGCAITLDMQQLVEQLKEELLGTTSNPKASQERIALMDKEFVFYQVAYRKGQNEFILPGAEIEKNDKLNALMLALKEAIQNFNSFRSNETEEQRNVVEQLNEIAYLFKTAEYQYENEIRLVIDKTGFEVQLYKAEDNPKAYIEIGMIKKAVKKITLGPKIERAAEWAAMFHYSLQKEALKPDIFISHLPFK